MGLAVTNHRGELRNNELEVSVRPTAYRSSQAYLLSEKVEGAINAKDEDLVKNMGIFITHAHPDTPGVEAGTDFCLWPHIEEPADT